MEPVYAPPITPQPIVHSYESSEGEFSEESENEDHAAEPLPSAVAGQPGGGNVLVTVVWIGGVVGAYCIYPHVRNACRWVKGTYQHVVKPEEPVVEPWVVPKAAPAI